MRWMRLLLGFVLAGSMVVFFPQCNSNRNSSVEEEQFKTTIDRLLDPAAKKAEISEVTGGAIYLDISISMQGYISHPRYRIPFTLLQHMLHNSIQTSFHHVGISKPVFRCFGGKIETPATHLMHYAISDGTTQPRARFNLSETNLVAVIQEASRSQSSLSVIITDGSQDVHNDKGELAPGFDRPELIQALNEGLIQKGFGVWLIGIMNDFDGSYYNIVPDRDGQINKPRPVYGKRPVYCWVISKNIDKGREYVEYLYADMIRLARSNSEDKNGNTVHVIEIAPGIFPGIKLIEPKTSDFFRLNNETSVRLIFILDWSDSSRGALSKIAARCNFPNVPGRDVLFVLQSELDFKLNYHWNSFPSSMWQIDVIKTHSLPMTTETRRPDTNQVNSANLRFIFINIPHDRLYNYNDNERSFEFPVCLYADLDQGLENSWIKTWSTVRDTEEKYIQGRTLYLYEVVSELLMKTIGVRRVGACIRLTLMKRNG